MDRFNDKEFIAGMNRDLKNGVPAEKMVRLAQVLGIDPTLLEIPPGIVSRFQSQKGLTEMSSYKSYADYVDELERAVADGTANQIQRGVAQVLGIEPIQRPGGMSYKGYSTKALPNLDPDKLRQFAQSLGKLGVDLTDYHAAGTSDKKFTNLMQSINTWLGDNMGNPATSMGNSKSSGGAGASSQVPSYGGPKAGPNPPKNQAAQKSAQDQAWDKSIAQLSSAPPWANPTAPASTGTPSNQPAPRPTEAQEYTNIASALLKPPPYYDRSRR